ncbi:Auxin-responsive protein [Actinidia chinensis var. chinensis]|uniref:Auxin-responsive protein n=1 Tax=Actinidia chinensis var. chinensis TaxID=1590841 RepID=A0A2R6Q2M6_ACTCC|nr:Auxin-responsive protein [Actinidia chinensis var. chinensis]
MELELGLALSLTNNNPTKGFDLNVHNGIGGWGNHECCLETEIEGNKKRGFGDAFENGGGRNLKLSLFSWKGQPNEDDDGEEERKRNSYTEDMDIEGEESDVVGWPPIKSWRKKLLHQHQGRRIVNDQAVERGSRGSSAMYVKVKMEGVAIGRKIDLRLFHSYHTLRDSLISMFAKLEKCEGDNGHYTLLYQDKDGDWLLAGDVPWKTFMESVCRLEILRNAG